MFRNFNLFFLSIWRMIVQWEDKRVWLRLKTHARSAVRVDRDSRVHQKPVSNKRAEPITKAAWTSPIQQTLPLCSPPELPNNSPATTNNKPTVCSSNNCSKLFKRNKTEWESWQRSCQRIWLISWSWRRRLRVFKYRLGKLRGKGKIISWWLRSWKRKISIISWRLKSWRRVRYSGSRWGS